MTKQSSTYFSTNFYFQYNITELIYPVAFSFRPIFPTKRALSIRRSSVSPKQKERREDTVSRFTDGRLYFTIKYSSSVVFNAMTNQDGGLHENGRKKTSARSTRTRETTFGILPISESMRLRESYSPRLAESVCLVTERRTM